MGTLIAGSILLGIVYLTRVIDKKISRTPIDNI